jgi:hypothetical protein
MVAANWLLHPFEVAVTAYTAVAAVAVAFVSIPDILFCILFACPPVSVVTGDAQLYVVPVGMVPVGVNMKPFALQVAGMVCEATDATGFTVTFMVCVKIPAVAVDPVVYACPLTL